MNRFLFGLLLGAVAVLPLHAEPVKETPTSAEDTTGYPPLPQAVSSFGAAVADGWVYVYGGHCGRTHQYSTEAVLGTFHRLHLARPQSWEELPSGPSLQGLALVAHQGKVYRIGGMQPHNRPGEKADNHSSAACACYDPATKKWTALPDLPAGRSSHDAAVVGNRIIVIGGWTMNGAGKKPEWQSTALVLDLSSQPLRWQSVKQPFQRRALSTAVHGDKVYVLGGLTPDAGTELTVNIYDPIREEWSTGPELTGAERNGFSPASCVVDGRLHVSPADGSVLRLTTKGDGWEKVGRLKQPRIVHRLVPTGTGHLLALGGASRAGNVAQTEAVTPSRP